VRGKVLHERPPAVLLEKLRWRETRTHVQEYSENFKRKMVQGASVRWERAASSGR